VSQVLARWNDLPAEEAARGTTSLLRFGGVGCGMAAKRPMTDEFAVLAASDEIWRGLGEANWLEAFRSHRESANRGRRNLLGPQSSAWSEQEQQKASNCGRSAKKTALKWEIASNEQSSGASYRLRHGKIGQRNFGDSAPPAAPMMTPPNNLNLTARNSRQIIKSV